MTSNIEEKIRLILSPLPDTAAGQTIGFEADPEIVDALLTLFNTELKTILDGTLVVDTLRRIGYRVVGAENCDAAMSVANSAGNKFDLLLSDMIMPKMTGIDLAEKIGKSHPGCRVIIMSGYFDANKIPQQELAERFHFLRKPFTARELAAHVRKVLDDPERGSDKLIRFRP